MALIVLDASVLIAHFDRSDSLHAAATRALVEHEADDLRLPASAYAETLVGAGRRQAAMRAAILSLGLTVEPITQACAERAAELRSRRRSLRLPDALVLGCAESLAADVVLTGDRRWRRYKRVRVLAEAK